MVTIPSIVNNKMDKLPKETTLKEGTSLFSPVSLSSGLFFKKGSKFNEKTFVHYIYIVSGGYRYVVGVKGSIEISTKSKWLK